MCDAEYGQWGGVSPSLSAGHPARSAGRTRPRLRLLWRGLSPLTVRRSDRFGGVDGRGCVKVRTNSYSVPLRAGTRVQVKVLPAYVEIWHEGQRVARHERCYSHRQEILDLEHYLEVLERKPGALAGSKPLEQWRRQGRWPASYDRL